MFNLGVPARPSADQKQRQPKGRTLWMPSRPVWTNAQTRLHPKARSTCICNLTGEPDFARVIKNFFFFLFSEPHLKHMEVPRLGVKWEL